MSLTCDCLNGARGPDVWMPSIVRRNTGYEDRTADHRPYSDTLSLSNSSRRPLLRGRSEPWHHGCDPQRLFLFSRRCLNAAALIKAAGDAPGDPPQLSALAILDANNNVPAIPFMRTIATNQLGLYRLPRHFWSLWSHLPDFQSSLLREWGHDSVHW